jgi:hypothetical protein
MSTKTEEEDEYSLRSPVWSPIWSPICSDAETEKEEDAEPEKYEVARILAGWVERFNKTLF